jgi:hypothetical protein
MFRSSTFSFPSRMPSFRIWRHDSLVISDVSEDRLPSILNVEGIIKLGITFAVNRRLLTLFIARWFFNHEDGKETFWYFCCKKTDKLPHGHRRENLKSYWLPISHFRLPVSVREHSIRILNSKYSFYDKKFPIDYKQEMQRVLFLISDKMRTEMLRTCCAVTSRNQRMIW